ncbi:ABC transporter permease [Wenyingzhuangia sp. IMCC45574]
MQDYFLLQFELLNRKFKDAGLLPWMAYLGLTAIFVLISNLIFNKAPIPGIWYIGICISILVRLSAKSRNEFLRFNFKNYRKVRAIENVIIVLPFLLFLIYKSEFILTVVFGLIAVLLSFLRLDSVSLFVMPAPFSHSLYEFQVGFRKRFWVYPVFYYLAYISTTVDNPNLGVAALIGIFLVSISYYSKPENEYVVWNSNLSPKLFLRNKIITAFLYTCLLSIPIICTYGFFFITELELLLLFYMIGCIYLAAFIFMKYSVKLTEEIELPQFLIYGLGVLFPPFLLFVILFFYKKSINNLKSVLYDNY